MTHFYKSIFSLLSVVIITAFAAGVTAQPSWKSAALNYIQQHLAKPDGGYGWEDQPDGHLTPTYAVIGMLNDLGRLPSNKESLIAYVKTHHPQRGKNIEAGPSGTEERDLVYQQIQSLVWLQAGVSSFATEVMAWKPQNNKVSNFEEHGYPVFLQEMMAPVCRGLLHVSTADAQTQFTGYLAARRRANGSYNNAPATDGGDGNIIHTYWGLYAAKILNINDSNRAASWIIKCQLKNGGFTHQPDPVIGGNDDVAYTWAAVKALALLSAEPADKAATIRYLISLRNDDGGFGNREGLPSKNSTAAWRAEAQQIADARKVPVTFFQSDEAYGKSVTVQGNGTFSHIMDYIAPAGANKTLDLDGSSWQRYRQSFIEPLLKDNGALILQVTNNEPLGRMILDESVRKGGFAAISTMHFGQNFSFWLPWLHQYRYQLPFIALQDAHGTESWWWVNELAGYRTLFLAKAGSYEDLMLALKNNWVAAVRHDSISNNTTRMLGGAAGLQPYLRAKINTWKWWKEGTATLNQPWAAITVVTPSDSFEVARPESGVNIRIRCWWDGVRQAIKEPLVKLESLSVDNKQVQAQYVERKNKNGAVEDSYYLYAMPEPGSGKHTIAATFRHVKNNSVRILTTAFEIIIRIDKTSAR